MNAALEDAEEKKGGESVSTFGSGEEAVRGNNPLTREGRAGAATTSATRGKTPRDVPGQRQRRR